MEANQSEFFAIAIQNSLCGTGPSGATARMELPETQDIDVASIEPIQSFLSLYIYYYIIEEEGCQRRKWVGRHGDAFADIFYGAYWDTHVNLA